MPSVSSLSDAPVIVVGNPRSGTTLLRLMLTCHPNICIPPEGPFIYKLFDKYGDFLEGHFSSEKLIKALMNTPKIELWGIDVDRVRNIFSEQEDIDYQAFIKAVYLEYMRKHDIKKNRWGDKSGSYTINGLPILKESFTQAFIIHIVRDGRDVACSYRGVKPSSDPYAPHLPEDILEIAYIWKGNLKKINTFLEAWPRDQQCTVLYEELVNDPESVLRKICTAIGESFHSDMLSFYEKNREKGLEPPRFLNWKEKTLQEVTTTQVKRWRQELDKSEVVLFNKMAGEILQHYGYEELHDSLSFEERMKYMSFVMRKYGQACRRYAVRLKRMSKGEFR